MSFKPMQFRGSNGAIIQTNATNAFELPPSRSAKALLEQRANSNPASGRNCLDIDNFAHNVELHGTLWINRGPLPSGIRLGRIELFSIDTLTGMLSRLGFKTSIRVGSKRVA